MKDAKNLRTKAINSETVNPTKKKAQNEETTNTTRGEHVRIVRPKLEI